MAKPARVLAADPPFATWLSAASEKCPVRRLDSVDRDGFAASSLIGASATTSPLTTTGASFTGLRFRINESVTLPSPVVRVMTSGPLRLAGGVPLKVRVAASNAKPTAANGSPLANLADKIAFGSLNGASGIVKLQTASSTEV